MIEFLTSKEIVKQIAERVEHERIKYEYTQVELAERAGIPQGTYRNFLATQRISLENMISLFQVLRLYPELSILIEKSKPKTLEELKKQEKPSKQRIVKRRGQ